MPEYDADLANSYGYTSPRISAEALAKFVDKNARIHDARAGTGLVEVELNNLGFTNIETGDMSEGMLKEAKKKGVYSRLRKIVLGPDMELDGEEYDAVISVGTLTVGHAPKESLLQLSKATGRYGYIVFTLRSDILEESGYDDYLRNMVESEVWIEEEASENYQPLPLGEPNALHRGWVCKKLP